MKPNETVFQNIHSETENLVLFKEKTLKGYCRNKVGISIFCVFYNHCHTVAIREWNY